MPENLERHPIENETVSERSRREKNYPKIGSQRVRWQQFLMSARPEGSRLRA